MIGLLPAFAESRIASSDGTGQLASTAWTPTLQLTSGEAVKSEWARIRTADDELDVERTWRAVSDAVWGDGAVDELGAAFAELGAVLPDLAAGLS